MRVGQIDPDDLDAWGELLFERQTLIDMCRNEPEAAALYRLGEQIETRLRISRAKIAAESAECYQTGFLLRALSADLAPRQQTGEAVNVQA